MAQRIFWRTRISSIDSSWWSISYHEYWNECQYCCCCYLGGWLTLVCTNTRRITAHFKNLCSLDTHWKLWNKTKVLNVGTALLDQRSNGHASYDLSRLDYTHWKQSGFLQTSSDPQKIWVHCFNPLTRQKDQPGNRPLLLRQKKYDNRLLLEKS